MSDEERIKDALVNIANVLADKIVGKLKYDTHFKAQVIAQNIDDTLMLQSGEKGVLWSVRYATPTKPDVGDYVHVRETKNVADSYMIDYIE